MIEQMNTASEQSLSWLRKLEAIGPLAVRMTLGLVFLTTGWGKLHNLETVTAFFETLHIPAAHATAAFVSGVELVAGGMLLLGLGTRIAALLLSGVMAVAIWTARLPELHGVVELANTIELAYLASFVWLLVSGGGAVSMDRLIVRWLAYRTPASR